MKRVSLLLWILAASITGCMPVLPPDDVAADTPAMRPEVFFAGITRSTGVLENKAGEPTQLFQVSGSGKQLTNRDLQLDQTVTFIGKDPESRTWLLHIVDAHHYTATLSDAAGPVEGEAYGSILHLHYAMKHPFAGHMEQWLYLQPDGKTVINEATISILGVTVARLSERITNQTR